MDSRYKYPSAEAISAALRVGGPMKDRRAPRGGARNEQRDLLDEYLDETEDETLETDSDGS